MGELAQHRSVVMCSNGIVASAQPLASSAGLQVLMAGGNAADAAIATAAVLNVTMPMMCGLGGDVFALYYQASSGLVFGVNGSGAAPRGATRDFFVSRGYTKMPPDGMLAPSVPGAVDAYATLLERFGTLPLGELLQPAIDYAERGFPVGQKVARYFAEGAHLLARFPTSARIFLPDGKPPGAGEILVQQDLGRSLREIAQHGRDAFYRGRMAQAWVAFSRENGGLFALEDLAEHRTEVYHPLHTDYRGYLVYQTAPPSQGLIMLEMLNLLEGFDIPRLGHNTVETIHLMVEAKKLAFADRLRYLGDPAFVRSPIKGLLSKAYAARRRADIDPYEPANEVEAGQPGEFDGDTTYFCVADKDGNAISLIHSLSNSFGCGQVVGDTGILPNNRAGRGFSLVEGHPNVIAPAKRTMHTLNCYMVFQGDKLVVVGGTPGGDRQPQWNVQVVTNLLDFGMNVQQAVEAPRWVSSPGTDPINIEELFSLTLEDGIASETAKGLQELGHRVKVVDRWAGGGGAMLIHIDPRTGVRHGGADLRTDGLAIGY